MALAEDACSRGESERCARLGLLHLHEQGAPYSPAEGARLLNVACQSHVPAACVDLGIFLRDQGVAAARDDAIALLLFACRQGVDSACAVNEEATAEPTVEVPIPPVLTAVGEADGGTAVPATTTDAPPVARGSLESLLRPGRILVLGAVFGTREAPAVIAQLMRRSTIRAVPTVLALDIDVKERERLAQFLGRPESAAAIEDLLRGSFWRRPYQDGRSSTAVLAMLLAVRRAVARGQPISVAAIDLPLAGTPHTAAFAEALQGLARQHPEAAVLTLLGNVQAPRVARLLGRPGSRSTLAVSLAHDGGESWSCTPNQRFSESKDILEQLKDLDCRTTALPNAARTLFTHTAGADVEPVLRTVIRSRTDGRERLYRLDARVTGYDFAFPLGTVSASRPATTPQ